MPPKASSKIKEVKIASKKSSTNAKATQSKNKKIEGSTKNSKKKIVAKQRAGTPDPPNNPDDLPPKRVNTLNSFAKDMSNALPQKISQTENKNTNTALTGNRNVRNSVIRAMDPKNAARARVLSKDMKNAVNAIWKPVPEIKNRPLTLEEVKESIYMFPLNVDIKAFISATLTTTREYMDTFIKLMYGPSVEKATRKLARELMGQKVYLLNAQMLINMAVRGQFLETLEKKLELVELAEFKRWEDDTRLPGQGWMWTKYFPNDGSTKEWEITMNDNDSFPLTYIFLLNQEPTLVQHF